jgi:hypothetical protein
MTRYTFAVYLTAPEPKDAEDDDGYTRADVVALLKQALMHPTSPFWREKAVGVDWECMDEEAVTP